MHSLLPQPSFCLERQWIFVRQGTSCLVIELSHMLSQRLFSCTTCLTPEVGSFLIRCESQGHLIHRGLDVGMWFYEEVKHQKWRTDFNTEQVPIKSISPTWWYKYPLIISYHDQIDYFLTPSKKEMTTTSIKQTLIESNKIHTLKVLRDHSSSEAGMPR